MDAAWSVKIQFAAFNTLAVGAVAIGAWKGGLTLLWDLDPVHLSIPLAGLFLTGLGLATAKVWDVAKRLDNPALDQKDVGAFSLETKMTAKIGTVLYVANTLAMSGLACTALGVITAMRAVASSGAADASQATAMIGNTMAGIGSAFSLSLIAIVLSMWTKHNFHMLKTASLLLLARQTKGQMVG
jgi:hypothetical protein